MEEKNDNPPQHIGTNEDGLITSNSQTSSNLNSDLANSNSQSQYVHGVPASIHPNVQNNDSAHLSVNMEELMKLFATSGNGSEQPVDAATLSRFIVLNNLARESQKKVEPSAYKEGMTPGLPVMTSPTSVVATSLPAFYPIPPSINSGSYVGVPGQIMPGVQPNLNQYIQNKLLQQRIQTPYAPVMVQPMNQMMMMNQVMTPLAPSIRPISPPILAGQISHSPNWAQQQLSDLRENLQSND